MLCVSSLSARRMSAMHCTRLSSVTATPAQTELINSDLVTMWPARAASVASTSADWRRRGMTSPAAVRSSLSAME